MTTDQPPGAPPADPLGAPPESSPTNLPSTSAALPVRAEGGRLFDVWAPETSPWSAWAKPVLFAQLTSARPASPAEPFDVAAALPSAGQTVVVVDLPGARSVHVAFAFAEQRGLRPVPLYNGVHHHDALLDNSPITDALHTYHQRLLTLPIEDSAPPVFMLDGLRLRPTTAPAPGRFDNRWMVFPQDFPSGHTLQERGIRRALVVGTATRVDDDLAHVLLRWQELGVEVWCAEDRRDAQGVTAAPVKITVQKPSKFRSLLYRAAAAAGLMRNAAGGFGGRIPEPTQSTGGRSG